MDEEKQRKGTECVDSIKIIGRIWQEGKDGPWKAQFRSLDLYFKAPDWKAVTERMSQELNDIADNFEWDLIFPEEEKEGDMVFSTDDHKYLFTFALDRIVKAR